MGKRQRLPVVYIRETEEVLAKTGKDVGARTKLFVCVQSGMSMKPPANVSGAAGHETGLRDFGKAVFLSVNQDVPSGIVTEYY